VYINGKFVGGCDIIREMHETGELEPLVKAALAEPARPQ
jgi:monothiol glutaredoxin